eukprot:jgi/Ulvmu1/8593/UM045_0036.1
MSSLRLVRGIVLLLVVVICPVAYAWPSLRTAAAAITSEFDGYDAGSRPNTELQVAVAPSAHQIEPHARGARMQAHLDLREVDAAGSSGSSSSLLGIVRYSTLMLRGVSEHLQHEADTSDEPAHVSSTRTLTNIDMPPETTPVPDIPTADKMADRNPGSDDNTDAPAPTVSGGSIVVTTTGSSSAVNVESPSPSSNDGLLVKVLVPIACALIGGMGGCQIWRKREKVKECARSMRASGAAGASGRPPTS